VTRAHAKESTYTKELKRQFGEIIEALPLGDLQKRFLVGRWLDQVLWFESNARYNQRRYYVLRLITIVGGVIVPALVSLNVRKGEVAQTLAWATFGLSLVVAISAALEAFFRYGERWRTFRRTAEALKAQGWQFFELSGPYQAADHATAFPSFAAQVEAIVQQDVEAFIALARAAQPTVDAHEGASKPP
jgi:Protein of unknown function (DUF4231)